jgi:hypothetical protein
MPDTRVRQRVGLPRVFDPCVTCPGGAPIGEAPGGSGCECRIERSAILASIDPSSLVKFCLSADGYQTCPTWQAEKQRVWARRALLPD